MANPATIDRELAIIEASTSGVVVALNPRREYSLGHTGKDASGSAATGDVYLVTGIAASDGSAGLNKALLQAGRVVVVGPNVSSIRLTSTSGAPTVNVSPGPYDKYSSVG